MKVDNTVVKKQIQNLGKSGVNLLDRRQVRAAAVECSYYALALLAQKPAVYEKILAEMRKDNEAR